MSAIPPLNLTWPGLDAATFLRFVRMMLYIFYCTSGLSFVLMILYIIYNVKNVPSAKRSDVLSMLTIANIQGSWMWAALTMTYLISTCCSILADV